MGLGNKKKSENNATDKPTEDNDNATDDAAEKAAEKKAKADRKQAKKDADKKKAAKAAAAAESEGEDEAAAAAAAPAPADEKKVAPAPADEKKVAPAPAVRPNAGAVAKAGAPRLVLALSELENAFPVVEFGTLPRIVAKQGEFYDDDQNSLGKEIELEIHSYHNSFAVSPNADKAPNNYCKFSYDNENLTYPYEDDEGTFHDTVAEHLAFLKEEGYTKAGVRRYLEVTCSLIDAAEENDNIGGMVLLSLSPQSVKQFERHQFQSTVKIRSGAITEEKAAHVVARAKTKTFGTNTFTMYNFSTAG